MFQEYSLCPYSTIYVPMVLFMFLEDSLCPQSSFMSSQYSLCPQSSVHVLTV